MRLAEDRIDTGGAEGAAGIGAGARDGEGIFQRIHFFFAPECLRVSQADDLD